MFLLKAKEALNQWDNIRQTLEESIPYHLRSPQFFIDQLRRNISEGTILCWRRNDGDKIANIVVTTIIDDYLLLTRNLCIFAAKSFIPTTKEARIEMFDVLAKYGSTMGCRNIIAYSNDAKIAEYALEMSAKKQEVFCFNISEYWTDKEDIDGTKSS